MTIDQPDLTNDSVSVNVKSTVHDRYELIDLLASTGRALIDLMDTMSMSCYPLEIELSLKTVNSSD